MMPNARVFSPSIHEPARMVERYLPESSFDVVYQVYNNLANVQAIANNLRTFAMIANNSQNISQVKEYLTEIQNVAEELEFLVNLSDNIDYLKSIEPDLNKIVVDIKDIKSDYDAFLNKANSLEEDIRKTALQVMNSLGEYFKKSCENFSKLVEEKQTKLEELAKKVHNDLDEISDSIVESYNLKNELNDLRCYILYSNAYVAVQDYKYLPNSETKARALNAIVLSESYGNDESVNRLRMNEA